MQQCPICSEPSGFHSGPCYVYDNVPERLRGPGNSKEFMVWLVDKDKTVFPEELTNANA